MEISRWTILAVLFFARAGMGFQYQTIASTMVALRAQFGLSLDQMGVLIGVYFLLGIALALPGGALGARFGSKRSVLTGLALMALGGALAALATTWSGQLAARILAGAGGGLINVMMSKMISDWFSSKDLSAAMGVFVSSWTFGVAAALVSVPWLSVAFGTAGVFSIGAVWAVLGFLAVGTLYRSPPGAITAAPAAQLEWPRGLLLAEVTLAGMIWGWFNAGFAMVFGFGPATLIENGYSQSAAGFAVSLVLWMSMASVPLGGFISDRTRKPALLIVLCPSLAAILILATSYAIAPAILFCLLGLIVGIPAGAIMALPLQGLPPGQRAMGMGIFFTVFYAIMVASPAAAGVFSGLAGSPRVAYQMGTVCMLFGLMSYAALTYTCYVRNRRLARPFSTETRTPSVGKMDRARTE